MSLFAKIWTDIESDEWFLGLSCLQRGVFLQLIVLAKNRGNSGELSFRSHRAIAENLGLDRSTSVKTLRLFNDSSHISLEEMDNGIVRIIIPKYLYYQEHKKGKTKVTSDEKPSKTLHPIEKSREEKSIAEQSRAENTIKEVQPPETNGTPEKIELMDGETRIGGEIILQEEQKTLAERIQYLPYVSDEGTSFKLAGWLIKKCDSEVPVAIQLFHQEANYLVGLKSVNAFYATMTDSAKDPEKMGRAKSEAYKQI